MTNNEVIVLWAQHELLYDGGKVFAEQGAWGDKVFQTYFRIDQQIRDVIKDKVVILPDGKVLLNEEGILVEKEIYSG